MATDGSKQSSLPFPTESLPADWKISTVEDCCISVNDGDWIETKDQGGGDYRLLQISNVGLGIFRETGNYRYISQETFDRLSCREVLPGNILVARMPDPTGRAWHVQHMPFRAITAVDVAILEPNEAVIDGRYCAYYLNSHYNLRHAKARAGGTTRERITRKDLAAFPLPLPPLPIQQRIAGILSAYDELIENSQRRIKILKSMARALYREWFVHFRFPGHEHHPRVPSPLGESPKGWEVKSFSELASYVNGYPFKPAQLGTEGKPIIKIKELKAGIVADTPRNLGDDIPEKYHISDGAVLFSWSADLDTYLWMGGDGLLNQHLFTVLPGNGLSHAFCLHSLKEAMPRFRALSLGATMHHIKRSALDQVFTVVAPETTRRRFDVLVEPMHTQLITLTRQVQNLRRTRDLLLPRLLSGQINMETIAS